MNAHQFFNLVVKMRKLQKEYFKHRLPWTLQESKRCEKEIDKEIKRVQKTEDEKRFPKFDFGE